MHQIMKFYEGILVVMVTISISDPTEERLTEILTEKCTPSNGKRTIKSGTNFEINVSLARCRCVLWYRSNSWQLLE